MKRASFIAKDSDVDQLMQFGGFPEPFLKGDKRHWNRWQKERSARVFRDDLTSLENVKDISQLELLSELLIPRIGSLLSINSLREDLHCSHDAVSRWLTILENLYVIYRLKPYGASTIKALQKEAKLFFWDWSLSTSKGACFENMMAGHLLKYCHLKNDSEGSNLELMYLRDKEKREVDFVVVHKTTPLFAVECKTGAKQISPHIKYFAERTNIPKFYQVHLGKEHFVHNETRTEVVPFVKFCCDLGL